MCIQSISDVLQITNKIEKYLAKPTHSKQFYFISPLRLFHDSVKDLP